MTAFERPRCIMSAGCLLRSKYGTINWISVESFARDVIFLLVEDSLGLLKGIFTAYRTMFNPLPME